MTDHIMQAVLNECKAFLQQSPDGPGTVILEEDYKHTNLLTYTMPLCLIDLMDAPEESQWIGGSTRVDWIFGFNTYQLEPDSYLDDDTTYSTGLMRIVDDIRRHFSLGFWLVPARTDDTQPMAMQDVIDNYGFKFTLTGKTKARPLDQEGLILGWRINFDSLAIDDVTDWIKPKNPLEKVVPTLPPNT